MFVRAKRRFKDGKEHRYWSVVENCRNRDGRVVQRQLLYLGEINDSQRAAWCRSIEVLKGDSGPAPMALCEVADDREAFAGVGLRGRADRRECVEPASAATMGGVLAVVLFRSGIVWMLDRFWGMTAVLAGEPAGHDGWLDVLKIGFPDRCATS